MSSLFVQTVLCTYSNEVLPPLQFGNHMRGIAVHLLSIAMFAITEKIRKELFVISLTNSKTKKQMMKIFNAANPKVLVTKEGSI